ncbi:MAG: hypothetical protein HKN31_00190 [Pricia sp.]|nr:hypothetical protein [Pricia sp.]
MKSFKVTLVLLMFLGLACEHSGTTDADLLFTDLDTTILEATSAKGTLVQSTSVLPFLPAGDIGGPGNQLVPGDFFPPISKSKATLKRGADYIQFNIHTNGLPHGAYTVWYVIFNTPSECIGPGASGGVCGLDDLFGPSVSVVWATGKVVKANGIGNFSDRIYVGESRSETVILGDNLTFPLSNPQNAEVHCIIKYHGLASEDPDILYDQLHTLLGNCGEDDGANSFLDGAFGIQCFDPQVAVFAAN